MKKILLVISILSITLGNSQGVIVPHFSNDHSRTKALESSAEERIFLSGIAAANTTSKELSNSLQGSQNISLTGRIIPQKKMNFKGDSVKSFFTKSGLDFTFGINMLHVKPTTVSEDTFDLNSLMFPEAGNFGIVFSPAWHWFLSSKSGVNHRLSSEFYFYLRQNSVNNIMNSITKNTEDVTFTVLNYTISPIRYSFSYSPNDDLQFLISIAPYWNRFNLPNEDANKFNVFFPSDTLFKKDARSHIDGLGVKVSASINGFTLYADIRQNRSTKNLSDDNPYKGFVFNVGIAQNLNILKF